MRASNAIIAVATFLAASGADAQCTKDTDCKGDRICDRGACVDAATVVPDKKAKKAQQEEPAQAAPAPPPASKTEKRSPLGGKAGGESPPAPTPAPESAPQPEPAKPPPPPERVEVPKQPVAAPADVAERAARDAVAEYARRALFLNLGVGLIRNRESVPIGFFGGGLDEIVKISPMAVDAAGSYSGWRAAWVAMFLLGIGAHATSAIMLATQAFSAQPDAGVVLGGLITLAVGLLFDGLAHRFDLNAAKALTRTVNLYNADLLIQLGGPRMDPSVFE